MFCCCLLCSKYNSFSIIYYVNNIDFIDTFFSFCFSSLFTIIATQKFLLYSTKNLQLLYEQKCFSSDKSVTVYVLVKRIHMFVCLFIAKQQFHKIVVHICNTSKRKVMCMVAIRRMKSKTIEFFLNFFFRYSELLIGLNMIGSNGVRYRCGG